MRASDVTKAAAWLEKLPAGIERDGAVAAYAGKVTGSDPEAAATWAATVTDNNKRENAVRNVYDRWKRTDEAAANRWLAATPALSPDAKKRMSGK